MALEALLPAIDALIIAAPAEAHFQLAAAALRAGKHVLVEKPIAAELAQADELAANGAGQRAGAAGRASGAVFRRLPGPVGTHRGAALHRGGAHRAVQAARHRCVGDPRSDDPRPRSGAGAGRQPDESGRRGRRADRQRAGGHRQCPAALRQWRGGDDHRQPGVDPDRAADADFRPRHLPGRGFLDAQADRDRARASASRCRALPASASRTRRGTITIRWPPSMRRSTPRCWMARRCWSMPQRDGAHWRRRWRWPRQWRRHAAKMVAGGLLDQLQHSGGGGV